MSKTATAPSSTLAGRVSRFAGAFSLGMTRRGASVAAGEDDDENPHKQRKGESDSDYAKRMRDDKDAPESRKQKAEESDEDFAKRMRSEDEKEEDPEAAGQRAEGGEKEEKEEGEGAKKAAAAFSNGVKAERARWENVLASKEANGKGLVACQLLSSTDMDAAVICKTLAAFPAEAASNGSGLARRMTETRVEAPASEGAAPVNASGAVTAGQVVAAAAKARGAR